jgi:hypothetical protein
MRSKRGKRKAAPGIVPRFLKGAVTIGAIPALVGACDKPRRVQPVVAYFAPPPPADANEALRPPPPPVVAAYQRDVQPVVAAYAVDAALAPPPADAAQPTDAAVDAPAKKAKTSKGHRVPPPPPPPVVAAMVAPPGPAVVAAYVPRERPQLGSGSGSAAKKPKKP